MQHVQSERGVIAVCVCFEGNKSAGLSRLFASVLKVRGKIFAKQNLHHIFKIVVHSFKLFMARGIPFGAGWIIGRALGLPILLVGFLLYAGTAFSRKLKKNVKSVTRFVLSLLFSISMFLFSLFLLEAAKEADYDLRLLMPVGALSAFSATSDGLSIVLSHKFTVSALAFVEDNKSFLSNALVAALLAPLFTRGIRAFLATLWWFICFLPNILHGFITGFIGSFEYAVCALSLTHHHKHAQW